MQHSTRSIMWTAIAAVGWATGGVAPPAHGEAWDVDFRKVRMVERYGLSAADPAVSEHIEQAYAVTSVTVDRDASGTWIRVDATGAPEYRSVIFPERRRFVLDLFNTLDVADGGPWDLGIDSPIRSVRHSQFQVQPDYICRIVCDLAPGVEPIVTAESGQLTIFVPAAAAPMAMTVALAPDTAVIEEDVNSVAPVVLEALAVEDMPAAPIEPMPSEDTLVFATAADAPVAAPIDAADGGAAVPWWMATNAQVDTDTRARAEIHIEETSLEPELVEGAALAAGSMTTPAAEDHAQPALEPEPAAEAVDEMTTAPEPAAADIVELTPEPEPAVETATAEVAPVAVEVVPAAPAPEPVVETLEPLAAEAEPVAEAVVDTAPEPEPAVETATVEVAPAAVEVAPAAPETEATPWWVESEPDAAPIMSDEPTDEIAPPAPVAMSTAAPEEPVSSTMAADDRLEVQPDALDALPEGTTLAAADDLFDESEPARTDVDDTVDTPSMPTFTAPDAPAYEPVVVEEPVMVDPPAVLLEPAFADEPLMQEPLVSELLAPFGGDAGPAAGDATTFNAGADPDPFEQTVTLTFRDADLNAVLDIIARKGRINMLAGRDVSGTVTVRLVDVPMDVALDAVLNVNGYGYIRTNNIYRIVPLSQIGGDEVETITETFELSYATAEDVKTSLESFLTRNGAIEIDERTNLLIVTDVPAAVARIAALVPQIDRRVQQALIEVVILDSVLTNNADLGIQWNLFKRDDHSPGAIGDLLAGSTGQDGVGINLPSLLSGTPGGILRFGTLIGDFNLNGFIEAQVLNANARVLANPKLLTLDNTTANIDIIEEFPFTDITQTSSGGQLSNISFKEVGTKLKVTPHITNDGYIILEIEPEQSTVISLGQGGVPVVATRRAHTTLLVQDHQTIVLGGLRVNRSNLSRTKIPGLGDIPGVRLLFRSTSTQEVDTEILLFLTTHIIASPPITPHERLVYEELANMPRAPHVEPLLWR